MQPGDRIAECFVIEARAGSGGMGVVYKARDTRSGQLVALKLMRFADTGGDRFAREARTLATLAHPGIVRYVEHGESQHGHYLAMEWLDGEDLATRLERQRLDAATGIRLVRRVAESLVTAHAQGVVHRDIKPANIFLRAGDVEDPVIVDFGIARMAHASVLTAPGTLVGTPSYMAPEQIRADGNVDARADIFSIGCVLFECIVGHAPFAGSHAIAIVAKVLFEPPPRVSAHRHDLPPRLDALVSRMLAKDPRGRPADATELVMELDQVLATAHEDAPSVRSRRGSAEPAVTTGERRLLSVVMGVPDGSLAEHVENAPTISLREVEDVGERMRAVAAAYDVMLHVLPQGVFVAAATATGPATDQAARAARCALALSVVWRGAVVLATGFGEFTGEVPVGDVIDRAAARVHSFRKFEDGLPSLVSLAPPSMHSARVLLDDATAGLLDARFELESDGGGLTLTRERAVHASIARTLLGRPTPCVGREPELAMLERFFGDCETEGEPRAVIVTASPGIGKSRLVSEFLRRIRERSAEAQVWIARADSMRAGAPFDLLAQIVRQIAGIVDGEPQSVRYQRLRARVARSVPPDAAPHVTDLLARLIGALPADGPSDALRVAKDDPLVMADEIRRAAVELLTAGGGRGPIILVLEDLHWGDLPTVRFIELALESFRERALLVVALARPEVHDVFPGLWEEHGAHEIRLGALGKRAAERLVREVLGERASDTVVERLVHVGAGNAFYLEELIRSVAEGREGALPETVVAMAHVRLEALSPDARRMLRAASIFGAVFWRGGLFELLAGTEREIDAQIDELLEREVIVRTGRWTFRGEEEYAFRHALLRDAAYSSLPARDRVLGHLRAACWLETVGETDAATLAEHFERGEDRERAVAYYVRAVEQALAANDFRAVVARSVRALDLGPSADQRRSLHAARGRALGALARWPEARAEHALALELTASDDDVRRAEQHLELAACSYWDLDVAEALSHADDAVALAERAGSAVLEAEAVGYTILTRHAQQGGNLDQALATYRRVLDRAAGRYVSSEVHGTQVLYWMGKNDESARRNVELADESMRRNELWTAMQALQLAGLSLAAKGQYIEAERMFAETRRIGTKHEIRTLLASSICMSGCYRCDVFDFAGARAIAEEAVELGRSAAFLPTQTSGSIDLLFHAVRVGDLARVEPLRRTIEALIAGASGFHGWLWKLRFAVASAEVELARRAWDDAITAATKGLERSRQLQRPKYAAISLLVRGTALRARARTMEARTDLREAIALAHEINDVGLVLRVATELVRVDPTEDTVADARRIAERIDEALPTAEMRSTFRSAEPVRAIHPALGNGLHGPR